MPFPPAEDQHVEIGAKMMVIFNFLLVLFLFKLLGAVEREIQPTGIDGKSHCYFKNGETGDVKHSTSFQSSLSRAETGETTRIIQITLSRKLSIEILEFDARGEARVKASAKDDIFDDVGTRWALQ